MASQSIALLSLSIVLSSYYLLAPAPLIADSYRIGGPRLPLATSLTHGFLDLMRLACPATFHSFLTIHLSSLRGPEWDAIDTPGYMRFRVLPWVLGLNISISLFLVHDIVKRIRLGPFQSGSNILKAKWNLMVYKYA